MEELFCGECGKDTLHDGEECTECGSPPLESFKLDMSTHWDD